MLKKAAYTICIIVILFCFLGCEPEIEKEGEWFDVAVMGITYSAYVNMYDYDGLEPYVVYRGNNAKKILNRARYHISTPGVSVTENQTYQEVVEILDYLNLPIEMLKKSIGSITAYYYISGAGHRCAAFVQDVTRVHSRSLISTGLLSPLQGVVNQEQNLTPYTRN